MAANPSRSSAVDGDGDVDPRFVAAVAAARLEALREFAYGAGHEINNPLANIAARAQALLLDEADPERRRKLATIVDQAFRARDMIGGLMIFARPPRPAPERVDADAVVRQAIQGLRQRVEVWGVLLEYSPSPQPVELFFDPAHAAEALRLVAENAIEATGAGERVVFAVSRAAGGPGAAAVISGAAAVISVSDGGRGMNADELRRAFDPFSSGREAGRGIGMGLPKAWRLLQIGGGAIGIESEPGRGTRVELILPAAA